MCICHHFIHSLGKKKMEQQTPIPPPPQKKLRIKTHENQKRATFPSSGDLSFPFILSKIVILEGIKHDSKPPVAPPPPATSPNLRMKPGERQQHAIFPFLILGEGGSRFSIYFVQDCSLMSLFQGNDACQNFTLTGPIYSAPL